MRTLKVIVGGESNVGKTALIGRYAKARLSNTRNITHGINVTTQECSLEDAKVDLAIWDIEGSPGNRPNFFLGTQAAMLVYDATEERSLQTLVDWYLRCKRYCQDAPIVIVGNKIDLGLRFPSEWPRAFALLTGAQHGFLSAETSENVQLGFQILAREALIHSGELDNIS